MITFDNTTLSDFKRCMRYGYYRHVRGWVEDRINPALLFGVAWHKAMSVVWCGKPETALEAFLASWKEGGGSPVLSPSERREYGSRTPETAAKLLAEYIRQRSDDISRVTVVSDEQFFLTEIDHLVSYCGTRDKVLRTSEGYIVLEHKTTASGSGSSFSTNWLESWRLNSQLDGYIYSTEKEYPDSPVAAVIDATLVSTRGMAFQFIPVKRTATQLKAWLFHTRTLIGQILSSWRLLGLPPASWTNEVHQFFRTRPTTDFLEQFPLNTEGCFRYRERCPYWNICVLQQQPEALDTPAGFVTRYWRPQDGKNNGQAIGSVSTG